MATLFKLGKKAGTTIFNALNPTQTGEILGNVEVVEREVAWALEFDGTGYVDCGNSINQYLTGDITIPFSILPREWGFGEGIVGTRHLYEFSITLASSMEVIWFYYGDGTSYDSVFFHVFPVGSVSKAVVVRDITLMKVSVYWSGQKIKEQAMSTIPAQCDYNLRIGYYPFGIQYYKGFIVLPVVIYARTLSDAEISLLSQGRYDEVSREGLVLDVRVDPSTGQIRDFSPYQHEVTIHGNVQVRRVMI